MEFSSQALQRLAHHSGWYSVEHFDAIDESISTQNKPWILTRFWYNLTGNKSRSLNKISLAMQRFVESASKHISEFSQEDIDNLEKLKGRVLHLGEKAKKLEKEKQSSFFLTKWIPNGLSRYTNSKFDLVATAITNLIKLSKKVISENDPINQERISSLKKDLQSLYNSTHTLALEAKNAPNWSQDLQNSYEVLRIEKNRVQKELGELKKFSPIQYKELTSDFQKSVERIRSCTSYRLQEIKKISAEYKAQVTMLYTEIIKSSGPWSDDQESRLQAMEKLILHYSATLDETFSIKEEEQLSWMQDLYTLLAKAEKRKTKLS